MVRSELLRELSFGASRGNRDDFISRLLRELKSQVTKSAETLNRDERPLRILEVPETVEDGHPSTKQGCDDGRLHVRGQAGQGFTSEDGVLSHATVPAHAVDGFVVADLVHPPAAGPARPIVAAVPHRTHPVADLGRGDARADFHNVTHNLVSRDARVDVAEVARVNGEIAVADAAGEDLDEDLSLGWVLELYVRELDFVVGFVEDESLVRLW